MNPKLIPTVLVLVSLLGCASAQETDAEDWIELFREIYDAGEPAQLTPDETRQKLMRLLEILPFIDEEENSVSAMEYRRVGITVLVEASNISEKKCSKQSSDDLAELIDYHQDMYPNVEQYLKHFAQLQRDLCSSKSGAGSS